MKFKLFDIEIELQFFAVLALTTALLLDKSSKVAICLLCAFIHECGHILTMLCFDKKPKSIKLRVFDIAIKENKEKTFISDLLVTLAGPLFNLLFACIFYFISTPLCICNMTLCVFNMLPIDTFDGGHALYLILRKKFSERTVCVILKTFTLIVLIPLLVVGIIVLFYSRYNYSLLAIAIYLLAILFIK